MKFERLFCLLVLISIPCLGTLLEDFAVGNINIDRLMMEIAATVQGSKERGIFLEQRYNDLTLLQYATYHENALAIRILIDAGADFRRLDAEIYCQPIQMVLGTRHIEIIEMLVKAGINPNTESPSGNTAQKILDSNRPTQQQQNLPTSAASSGVPLSWDPLRNPPRTLPQFSNRNRQLASN